MNQYLILENYRVFDCNNGFWTEIRCEIELNLASKKALNFDNKSVHWIMINFKKFIYVENVNDQITKHVL